VFSKLGLLARLNPVTDPNRPTFPTDETPAVTAVDAPVESPTNAPAAIDTTVVVDAEATKPSGPAPAVKFTVKIALAAGVVSGVHPTVTGKALAAGRTPHPIVVGSGEPDTGEVDQGEDNATP
jgi:hypothetical protein